MKIALSWLKQYLDIDCGVEELSRLLTFAGIEVEGIEEIPALGKTAVVGHIVSAERVPKTDHLWLCMVDIGDVPYAEKDENNQVQVICGAPNCRAGMNAMLALPGTNLKDFQIKKAKIRGIESHGMLCSEKEVGISDNHSGIIQVCPFIDVGTQADELFSLPDTTFELEITPDRSDLLGYLGIARDLSAKLLLKSKEPVIPALSKPEGSLKIELTNLEPELCPRYTLRVIEGVKIFPSPHWLQTALLKSGLRPINSVVDITNYVMLETGHPLHAFDYDKLVAKEDGQSHPDIIVRRAEPKEEFLALEGKKYILDGDELLIADGKSASALAGVMGGLHTSITFDTVNIALESAVFEPGSVRKTSYKHKLSTDSSYRFERHLSGEYAASISDRAASLILEIAGGKLCGEILDSHPIKESALVLGVRPARFELLIGYKMDESRMRDILERLEFNYVGKGMFEHGNRHGLEILPAQNEREMALYFEIPGFRKDVTREVDILEELSRLDGYDKVPEPEISEQIMDRHAYKINNAASDWLVAHGAFETLNYSFVDPSRMKDLGFEEEPEFIRLINPQSANQSVMRVSLIPQLLSNLAYNLNHSERDIRLFELGRIYLQEGDTHREPKRLAAVFTGKDGESHFAKKAETIDYFWVKGCFEGYLAQLRLDYSASEAKLPYLTQGESFVYHMDGVELGYFGRILPPVLEAWDIDAQMLKQEVWVLELNMDNIAKISRNRNRIYEEIPRYPSVQRDLSILVPLEVSYAKIKDSILNTDRALVQSVSPFDEYRSDQIPQGFRSLSLHIVLQDQEKTLTDERIDMLMVSVQKTLKEELNVSMR
ncbi:MAG: phenylalanine--tRNA ligase subunit beta [Candidatus Cloacimonetes bacterium]|jgi:phenylalanyl-tRNA synthetase beta chain|nr:phenylalanine--tRNA ligase subunit beta [Candidatus Cloacimonadota bacterium]